MEMTKKHKLDHAFYEVTRDGATYPKHVIHTLVGLFTGLKMGKYENGLITEWLNWYTECGLFARIIDEWGNVHYRRIEW